MNCEKSKVYLLWDENLIKQSDRLPAVLGRASLVYELIMAYDTLKHLKVVRTTPASDKDLKLFHSDVYIDHIKKFVHVDDDYIPSSLDEQYGFGYDCPPVSDMYNLVSTVAGSSITAAKCLLLNLADVVINWCGGWHHANRYSAEGFCYVNDIVIAIERLRNKFPRILYIDLDVHHGNGVQDAYRSNKSVFTLSFHKYEPGFYPGTGNIEEVGFSNGQGYTCNFPLFAAYSDKTFQYAFEQTFNLVYEHFIPDAVVMQCGADALANDPHGGGGLTIDGYCTCIRLVLDKRKPTMLLGGGGYNFPNTAKLWASITALAAGVSLDENIPEHKNWPKYGPDYLLPVQPLLGKDLNTKEYLDTCIRKIQDNLVTSLGHYAEPQAKKKKPSYMITSIRKNPIYNKDQVLCKNDQTHTENVDVYEFND